jgi:UDP-N-acetylmuramate--alanine ligase
MNKIRIGIIFGGRSKEREISFAGGRTVYDNLNKTFFEPVPLFVDSWGNFVLLNWEFIYKGSIRDFYPPVNFISSTDSPFQLYAENLGITEKEKQIELLRPLGKPVEVNELKQLMDFAFLCLHGPNGEDGRLQGLFEYLEIPYSGSGILPSAIGIDKGVQKNLMKNAGFNSPPFFSVERKEYISGNCKGAWEKAKKEIGFPMVIKPANQGSSIGVTILSAESEYDFMTAVEKALFTRWVDQDGWNKLNDAEKIEYVRQLADIREGMGLPVRIGEDVIYDPLKLISYFDSRLKTEEGLVVEALEGESTVLVEGFIEGKEFSCIVVEDENRKAIALPPTEIRKGKELFDYRSKYLPGLSRKITPIDIEDEKINAIRKECERLFRDLNFDVYARIDGFIKNDGTIFLNDPNTTSGMLPSSFFFHQAAEIGLSPSQFLTFIIRTSLSKRILQSKNSGAYEPVLKKLDKAIQKEKSSQQQKIKIAVLLGGYSSERHISVESGRNVFEKLSSSEKYSPIPVFLTGSNEKHLLYQIPVNILLKDNADDIYEKATNYTVHPVIKKIMEECKAITEKYASADQTSKPLQMSYADLKEKVEQVFIALHGRPGEDGAVQVKLEEVGLTYNGSGKESSSLTIDKYQTNELLKQHGMHVAEHLLITLEEWKTNKEKIKETIAAKIRYPFIAKPVDDGCSSAVKKIKTPEEFEAFATLIFRREEALDKIAADILHIKAKEEFPMKHVLLVEELISRKDAKHFLEITGGMLTRYGKNGELVYEVFEASEALSEGDVLSLEEKFLAGQGQNITPARYSKDAKERDEISKQVKEELGKAARVLNVMGYCRIDAFVRVYDGPKAEIIFIEVNSLPGMTPATCIFHQAAINNYKPYEFIDRILDFGMKRKEAQVRL